MIARMPPIHPAYLAHERQRWLRHDAHRFLRPDWRRFVVPGSELAAHYESIEQKYRPDQARVPAGNAGGGQWTDEGAAGRGIGSTSRSSNGADRQTRIAQAGFGRLVAEIPVSGGRNCVYNFGTFLVVVPGPANFRCMALMPLAGTTHGGLLNDNRR